MLEIYGDGELLYSAEVGAGIDPIPFNVDLTGVLEMTIKCRNDYWNIFGTGTWGSDEYGYYRAALGNCGLWA